ncbi:MAG: sigma-54-dependent Fis family transcriptional regulator [Firmicutes bacterium]|jgi:PAS domain S-box-containing protein|nr:sigma-54-dependent Fis family transcriptional regulator [Bacillota bacterium]MDH7495513.1 sigma-54-dependent Fis family transcriptional regulator [Bacillota bacterium]
MGRPERFRLSNRELEVILNSTHDGMIAVDRRGLITIFNAAAARITGLDPADMIGKRAQNVIPNTRLHIVLESGQAELNQQQVLGGVKIITNRVPVRNSEGHVIGAVAVFRDISEVIALAEEITNLRQIQGLLEAIINSTQDAISVVDENGNGLLINPAYTRLTGLTEEDVIGKPATTDIAEGESMHMKVLRTRLPVRGARMKVGPRRKEVIVHAAPLIVGDELRGSVAVIHDTSEIRRLTEELDRAKTLIRRLEAKYTFDDIVGVSPKMARAIEQARRVAATPVTVLLRGESGTGKELFAHAIHNASDRSHGQFIRVNCTAIVDTLLESELFGYEEGAFTGARRGGKRGLFEEANGGTIFLDEVGATNLALQAKLLRVLQEKEIVRVGDTRPIPVDVRVIAATNTDLERAVREGRMREDLYYRLNVVPIFIPPLRERIEDIPVLCHSLIRRFNQAYGRNVTRVSDEALDILIEYDWPGNVRELENVLSRAIISMHYSEIEILPGHLPALGKSQQWPQIVQGDASNEAGRGEKRPVQGVPRLRETVERAERRAILRALEAAGGNKTAAAKLLGIGLRSLYYKIRRYGIS